MPGTDDDIRPLPGLARKSALIVGGTRGVGRAVAEKFAASGCDVTATYNASKPDAEALTADLAGAPGRVAAVHGDAREPSSLARLMHEAHERYGCLDVLVHAAASAHPMPTRDMRTAGVRDDMATALTPLAAGVGPAAELMSRDGRIVVVSASVARGAAPHLVSLGVAKAALESLTRFAAVDLAERGITVNAVSASKLDRGPETRRPEAARALAERTPAGRLAASADAADAVALLCLPESRLITGQVFSVDGGLDLLA